MAVPLTQAQSDHLLFLRQMGRYPEAYLYMRDLVVAANGDASLIAWLEKASSINANDGGVVSEFVRDATWEAAFDDGQTLTHEQFLDRFQEVSNQLAEKVFQGVLDGTSIPDLNTILRDDVRSAVQGLGLEAEGWAGTGGAWLPLFMQGLDLPTDAPLYQDLYKSFRERGYDSFFEIAGRWLDVFENNPAGRRQRGGVARSMGQAVGARGLDDRYARLAQGLSGRSLR